MSKKSLEKENNLNSPIGYAELNCGKIKKNYAGILFEQRHYGGEQDPYNSEERFYTLPIKGKRYKSYLDDISVRLPAFAIWNSSVIKKATFKGNITYSSSGLEIVRSSKTKKKIT